MPEPGEHDIASAIDQILDPVWRLEHRRHRRQRALHGAGRVGVLLAAVVILSAGLGMPVALPEIVFFAVLGTLCVLAPEPTVGHRSRSPEADG